jgi:O-antigen ligase
LSGTTFAIPSATAPAAPAARRKPAFYLAIVFVFVVYARFPEILDMMIGTGLHSARLILGLSLLATLLTGSMVRAAFSKVGLCMWAFTAWFCLCIPFSIWRGGSFKVLREEWVFSIAAFLIVAAAVQGWEQCRQIMYSLAAATVFIEFTGILVGRVQQGRLALLAGTLGNANYLAMILLMGMPFCLFVIRTRRGFSLLKTACLITVLLAPLTIVSTGSRGGLLTMIFMFLLYFLRLPLGQKAVAVIVALLVGFIAVARSSQSALDRYKTIFVRTDQTLTLSERSAVESSEVRKGVLMASLRMTAQHPLLGVGPGMFQVANAKDAEDKGRASWNAWHETHNAFTQISCEDGIPALLLYAAALYLCFRTARAARKRARRDPACAYLEPPAFALFLSLVAFTGTALFTSIAYSYYFPLLAGLCVAFERAMPAAVAAPQPANASPTAAASRPQPTRETGRYPASAPLPQARS